MTAAPRSGMRGRPEPLHTGPAPFLIDLDLQDEWDARDRHFERADACPCCAMPEPCNVTRLPTRLQLIDNTGAAA